MSLLGKKRRVRVGELDEVKRRRLVKQNLLLLKILYSASEFQASSLYGWESDQPIITDFYLF